MSDDERDKSAGRATIRVSVGEVNLTAILDEDWVLNAVHKKVLERICEQDRSKKIFDEGVDIELDIAIDGRAIKTSFHVVGGLYADMILGKKFFEEVDGQIYLELKLLEWIYQKKTITTNLLQNNYNLASSKARDKMEEKKKEVEKYLAENVGDMAFGCTPPQSKGSDKSEEKKEKKSTKTSKENKDSPKKKFVSVFIVEREQWDKTKGKCSAYYGVYSPQKNISFLTGEKLDLKKKSPLGYHMEAFGYAFETADKLEIDHLHIVAENKYALELMENYRREHEAGKMVHEAQPVGLGPPDDYSHYYMACFGLPKFESMKFECVSYDNDTYSEMVQLRKMLDDYIKRNPK